MKKYLLIGGVAFATILVASAGIWGYWWYDSKIKPVKAYESASEIVKSVKTSDVDMTSKMDMNMVMKFLGESYTVDGNIDMTGEGSVDVENKKAKFDIDAKSKFTSEGQTQEESSKVSEVLVGDDIYLNIDNKGFEKVTSDELSEKSGISIEEFKDNQIWASLSDSSDYEYMGKEELNGKKVYKYKVNVKEADIEKLYTDLFDQMKELDSNADTSKAETKLEGIEMYVWVDASTKNPVKEYIKINKLDITMSGDLEIEFHVKNMEVTMVYSKINEPVTIEAPKL